MTLLDHAGVDQRVADARLFGRGARIVAKRLGTQEGIVGDSVQKIVLELVVLEITRTETRALFEHHDAEAGERQLARHHAARGARAHYDEVDGIAGFENACGHETMVHVNQLPRQDDMRRARLRSPDPKHCTVWEPPSAPLRAPGRTMGYWEPHGSVRTVFRTPRGP